MKKNLGQLTGDIYALLEGQSKEDSLKVITSLSTLLGLDGLPPASAMHPAHTASAKPSGKSLPQTVDPKTFFDEKDPKTKGEALAVAAKFRIDNNLGETHKKEDFKTIIKGQAKRVFDDNNFKRDIDNAIRSARFFLSGDAKGTYVLSAVGERFVNALPDRAAALKTRNSGKGSGAAKRKKKASKK